MQQPDLLVEYAGVVADGDNVDWTTASSGIAERMPTDAAALRELQIIAEIARLHRRTAEQPNPQGRWGALLMHERVGWGSFGEVFRAWDTQLDREVALKILRQPSGPDVADAIVREGQLLARVNHPNVMAVYGAATIDGTVGIWGEFLRGRTLAQIIGSDGPMSAEEALVAMESVCRAVSAVHRAGLLHRDIKAQNVMREQGGRLVLTDFGLGREAIAGVTTGRELAGTPLYLAPELLNGGSASALSDIYSLGVLMFYLVSGTFPVTGRDLPEITAAHGSGTCQRLEDVRPDLPSPFVTIVTRALEKDPTRRFASCGELQSALAAARHVVRPGERESGEERSRWAKRLVLASVLSVAVTASVGAALWWTSAPTAVPASLTFALEPPAGTRYLDSSWNSPAVSPNGQFVAVVAMDEATRERHVWVHSLKTGEHRRIPESLRAVVPFWSPDGGSIAFFAPEGLRRVSLEGVRGEAVAAAGEPRGGTWGPRGILFAPDQRGGLYLVSVSGDAPKPALVIGPDHAGGELAYMWPQFLPDGDRFIYFTLSNDENVRGVYLSSLSRRERQRLVPSDASGIVAQDSLLFVRDNKLAAQDFDLRSGRVAGEPVVLAGAVAVSFDYRSVATASEDGTLVYASAEASRVRRYGRTGQTIGDVSVPAGRYRSPALSRDGRYLAVQRYRDALSQIVVFDLQRGGVVALLTGGGRGQERQTPDVQFATWGPGHQLAYAARDLGPLDIYIKDISSSEPPRLLLRSDSDKMLNDWAADGRLLAYTSAMPTGVTHVWFLAPDAGTPTPIPFASDSTGAADAHFSPRGDRIAYVSYSSGRAEIWVRDAVAGLATKQVSIDGGLDPAWASNDEVSFLDSAGRLMIARVPRDWRTPAVPELAFATAVRTPGASRNNYSWSADGREVVFVEPSAPNRVFVVTNWWTRLRARP